MVEFILGLIAGIILSALVTFIVRKLRPADRDSVKACGEQPGMAVASQDFSAGSIANRPQFVAAVAASIASFLGTDVSGLRIRSIRRVSVGMENRQQFVAAVSAALATAMGTAPGGLRIRSIRRLSDGGGDRRQLVAAMSAALATAMGTEISGLRIHSIKQK